MARPKMLTEEQRAEQRQKWFAKRDERRRHQYAEDPEYREARRAASREDFRKRTGVDFTSLRDSRANLDKLDDFGNPRDVVIDGTAERYLTFTLEELAKVLGGYSSKVVRRWISHDKLPAPILTVTEVTGSFGRDTGTSDVQVYLEPEVRAIIEVFGPHQAVYANYRADHYETTRKLYEAVDATRAEIGL